MKFPFHRMVGRITLLAVGAFALISATLSAQCVAGNICVPVVSGVTGQPNAIDVHWLPGGGTPPQRVVLMKGGSPAKGYNDGAALASAAETSPLGQYASYDLHVGNLPANTSFPLGTLHVVGFWPNENIASAGFGAATQANQAGSSAPTITQSNYDQYGRFNLSWNGNTQYSYYNVRWSSGTSVAANAAQNEVGSGGGGSFTYRPDSPGPYTFIVEGCQRTPLFGNSTCSSWSQPVTLYATQAAAPTSTSLSFPHSSSGDCEMQSATIVFRSNGTGLFSSQVKTNHTHSGDVWHATIAGRNAAGQDIVSLSTFDSMRMDDDHGYYPWSQTFNFDPTRFSQIVNANMSSKC